MKDFNHLITSIESINSQLKSYAANAINQSLTIRNWLIGYYIVEFEQNGNDRAEYGESLLKSIANKFTEAKGLDERSLRKYRQFYNSYPQLTNTIRGSLTPFSENQENTNKLMIPGEKILAKLSYTHIEQLLGIKDSLKRTFYE